MKYINRVLDYLLFIILGVMSFTMALNVTCRFCFSFSIYWADELTQSLMLWLTFLGAAVAVREHLHYSFNYIEQIARGRWQKILAITNKSITLVGICILLFWSIEVTEGIASWIMPAMEFSRAWIYGACPVGCVFMLLYCIIDIMSDLKTLNV